MLKILDEFVEYSLTEMRPKSDDVNDLEEHYQVKLQVTLMQTLFLISFLFECILYLVHYS